jgi:SdpC family antimicrobial peptide
MKNIRKQARKISLVFGLSILFVSCSQNEDFNSKQQEATIQQLDNNYSGIDLFKGIFFSEGPIATKLSNNQKFEKLKGQFTNEQKIAFVKLQNDLISEISKNYPTYFSEFEKSIESGNQIKIRSELEKSKVILKNAVQKITDVNFEEIEKNISKQKTNLVVNLDNIQSLKEKNVLNGYNPSDYSKPDACVAVWAVAVVVAAVAWVAVYVDIVYWSVAPNEDSSLMKMEGENFVNSIAQLNDYK